MNDPLADWYVHPLTVTRPGGVSGNGPISAAPETIVGYYQDRTVNVIGMDGEETTAAGVFTFPLSFAYVPVNSRVALPAEFGGRTVTVIASSTFEAGAQPTPNSRKVWVR